MTRVIARLLVDAIRRRAEAEGGAATVLARGDAEAGAILIVLVARDGRERLVERAPTAIGSLAWRPVGPNNDDATERVSYIGRRRQVDPDLWVLELAHLADPEALLDGLIGSG